MTCNEFRSQFHASLDARSALPMSPNLDSHRNSCHACASYTQSMLRLDRQLQNLPEVDLPESLFAIADSIEAAQASRTADPPWTPYIVKGAVLIFAASIMWLASMQMSPIPQQLLRVALASAGFFMVLVTSLRPRFVSENPTD